MGRRAKPVQLQLIEGNPNRLTKDEIDWRQKSQIRIGSREYSAPAFVVADQAALAKWNEVKKIFDESDSEIVTSADVSILARYCMTWSQYLALLERKGRKQLSLSNMLKLDNAINRKMTALMAMEDRMFLNALARVKNIPRKPEEQPDAEQMVLAGL